MSPCTKTGQPSANLRLTSTLAMTPIPEPQLPKFSPDSSLTPAQHKVLALLADGRSIIDAAAAAGVHRNTVRNWRRALPAFAREAEWAAREQALAWHDCMVHLAPHAAHVLHHLLHDDSTAPALRLRAALAVLKAAADPQPKPLPFRGSKNRRKESSVKQLPSKTIEGCAQENSKNMHNRAQQPSPPGRRKRTHRTRSTAKLRLLNYSAKGRGRPTCAVEQESG